LAKPLDLKWLGHCAEGQEGFKGPETNRTNKRKLGFQVWQMGTPQSEEEFLFSSCLLLLTLHGKCLGRLRRRDGS